jgi:fumarate hydratase subunit beta
MKKIITPLADEVVRSLRAGDEVAISGIVYTARDAAHKRLYELIEQKEKLPIPIEGSVICRAYTRSAGESNWFGRTDNIGKNG